MRATPGATYQLPPAPVSLSEAEGYNVPRGGGGDAEGGEEGGKRGKREDGGKDEGEGGDGGVVFHSRNLSAYWMNGQSYW